MANRRMIHKSISSSRQVNSLSSDFIRLLFTWMIPYLDDFGKISGDAFTIKAQVVPALKQTTEEVEKAIQELVKMKLINRYEANEILVIEFPTFETYQIGLTKRTKSKFLDNPRNSNNFSEILRSSEPTEHNRIEKNLIANRTEKENSQKISSKELDPTTFSPRGADESAALEAFKLLEPDNPRALGSTYMRAKLKGLPIHLFFQFASEIKQDPNIKNKGAVFNAKVEEYFKNKR